VKDLVLDLDSHERPMSAAAKALAGAGVNIEGTTGPMTHDGSSVGHILVEDGPTARRALEEIGIKVVAEREVVVVELQDRPGALSELLERIGPRTYDLVYLATRTRIVLGGREIADVTRILASVHDS